METDISVHLKKALSLNQRRFLKALPLCGWNVAKACLAAKVSRSIVYSSWLKEPDFKEEFDNIRESGLDEIEAALRFKAVEELDVTALIFICKTQLKSRGYVQGAPVAVVDRSPVLARVLDDLLAGTTTIERAALTLTKEGLPLPEVIRTLLAKVAPPEPIDDLPAFSADPEEMDRRYQAAIENKDRQKAVFVPERIAEVEEIKRKLSGHEAFLPQEMES